MALVNPIIDVETFRKLIDRASNSDVAPCADGLCDMISDDFVRDVETNAGEDLELFGQIVEEYMPYLKVMNEFKGSYAISKYTIEDFECRLNGKLDGFD